MKRPIITLLRVHARRLRRLLGDRRGATTLEWALLLAAIALPSWFIIRTALATLVGHYRMMAALNALPFP
jgi:Flp pilus assembly pilin Flp